MVRASLRFVPALFCLLGALATDASAQPRPGAVGEFCGGMMGRPCDRGLFCKYSERARCGIVDQSGACAVKPEMCTREYAPVCGCNRQTYGNACTAYAAGQSVFSRGACPPGPGADGAACGSRGNAPCNRGVFCFRDVNAACGATDIPGVCKARPTRCTRELRPVCGCDGRTYSNRCGAMAAGASIKREGACAGVVGARCGTYAASPCTSRLFCKFEPAASCGAADHGGTCQSRPQMCTMQFDPVCGCDGRTYSNACMAASSGASVKRRGSCRGRR